MATDSTNMKRKNPLKAHPIMLYLTHWEKQWAFSSRLQNQMSLV